METKKCKFCKTKIPQDAKICLHCKKDVRSWFAQHWIISSFIWLFILWSIMQWYEDANKTTSVQSNLIVEKTEDEIRIEKIEKQFSAWDGSHRSSEILITTNLKDPGSYEMIKTVYVDKWEYIIVQTKYRAKNSFGWYVIEYYKAKFDLDWNFIEIHDAIFDEE